MFFSLLIRLGRWAEGKRDTAILKYAQANPTASAGYIARKFGLRDHQAVTGILRENGVKRPVAVQQSTGSPLADDAREAGAEVKVVDIHPTDAEMEQHQLDDAAEEARRDAPQVVTLYHKEEKA